ncbi:hypothetical protein [Spiroplasma sp. DGKH1]|uniref:hypothetical protein n=1 Tax=Spiroplasma sp. DGKH1 TaxID=3050074 RepID=UPI0034C5C997
MDKLDKFLKVNIFSIAKSYYRLLATDIQIHQTTKDYLDSAILFLKKQLNNFQIEKIPGDKLFQFYKNLKQESDEIVTLCIKLNYILFLHKSRSSVIKKIINLQNEDDINENSYILNESEILSLSLVKKCWYQLVLF